MLPIACLSVSYSLTRRRADGHHRAAYETVFSQPGYGSHSPLGSHANALTNLKEFLSRPCQRFVWQFHGKEFRTDGWRLHSVFCVKTVLCVGPMHMQGRAKKFLHVSLLTAAHWPRQPMYSPLALYRTHCSEKSMNFFAPSGTCTHKQIFCRTNGCPVSDPKCLLDFFEQVQKFLTSKWYL